MRSLPVLFLSTSIVALSVSAAAQDHPAPPAAASAPAPAASAAQTSPATSAPSAQTAPPPAPVVPPPAVKREDEQEPLRLGRLIESEADRAHARRVGGSVVGIVTGAGIIASGGIIWAVGVPPGIDATAIDTIAVMTMAIGGLQIVTSLVSLVVPEPMERLFDAYAPVAIDKDLAPSERVRRGEVMLGAMAESERSRRTTEATTNLVFGVLEAGFAVFVGADDKLVFSTDPSTNGLLRGGFAVAFGFGAAAAIGQAVGSLLWERGPAEVAWEHWQASHGTVTVHESKLEVRPVFTPMLGGGTAGLRLRF